MRVDLCRYSLLLVMVGLAPSVLSQKFQEPTKEELQMTSDPKAPGVAAVFLYRQEEMDNSNHFQSVYARIKVLTEKGKEWATVDVPYEPGMSAAPLIEGRTIHSDGKIISLVGKPADLLVFKTRGFKWKTATFTLPDVEVGSILEYKWTLPLVGTSGTRQYHVDAHQASEWGAGMPDWNVQQDIFVHKERFQFVSVNRFDSIQGAVVEGEDLPRWQKVWGGGELLYKERLPPGVHVVQSIDRNYALDVENVPPIIREPDSPPVDSFRYRVLFYVTPNTLAEPFWKDEQDRWLKEINGFAVQTKAIKDAATQITQGDDTPEGRARKLYEAVQALENTDFGREKSDAERAAQHLKKELKSVQDIWDEKSGDSNDLAALYLALARAAGLEVYAVQIAERSRSIFDPNYLSLNQLKRLLVVLRIDGKDIYLDPGEKFCPFGQLAWEHALAGGIRENVKGPVYTPANSIKDSITAHTADLILDEHGAATGTVKVLMNGQAALYWRQLNLTEGPDEVKKRFDESLRDALPQGISGETTGFQGIETSAGYLTATVKVSGQLGTTTGKRMLTPGFFFSAGAPMRFSGEARETPFDLHYAEQVIDDVVYHLPPGFAIESAPQATQLPWPDHAALVVKTTPGAGMFEIKHIFARAFVVLDAKEYPALRDYSRKVAENDQQQVVLVRADAATGT
jgi:hypothetical protein